LLAANAECESCHGGTVFGRHGRNDWSAVVEVRQRARMIVAVRTLMLQEMRAVIFVMTHSPIGETWLTGGHGNYFGKFCAPPPPPPLSVMFGLPERSVVMVIMEEFSPFESISF
uniref:Cytochrome c domain-containing protein n=1 Tax=Ascaris lumbricoides TaxID=6252 RepID=A0A0M3IN05_ASCLU